MTGLRGPRRSPRAVDAWSWLALVLGTTVGPILVDISQGLPRTRWGWAALVVGAALVIGLVAATAMERAGGSGGRSGRRRWRPRANRRRLLVLGVIVLLVLTAFFGSRTWQRTRPCGEAIGLPVAAVYEQIRRDGAGALEALRPSHPELTAAYAGQFADYEGFTISAIEHLAAAGVDLDTDQYLERTQSRGAVGDSPGGWRVPRSSPRAPWPCPR